MERIATIFPLVQQLEQDHEALRKRFQQLEATLFQKDKQILGLQKDLQHEKSITALYTQLLLKHFPTITLPNTISSIDQADFSTQKSEAELPEKKRRSKKSIKKSRFIPVKSAPEEADEKESEEKRKREEKFTQLLASKDYTEQTKIVRAFIESFSSERTVKKTICENIKKARRELLRHTSLQEYMKILDIHNTRLKELFEGKKWNFNDAIIKLLNPLDSHLLLTQGFQKVPISIDDIEPLRESISLFLEYDKTYVVFSLSDLFKKIVNQSLAFLSLQEIFRYVFDNPYGYHNLICYSPSVVKKSTDLFGFYSLESLRVGPDGTTAKRKWRQELRLQFLSTALAEKIRSYCCDYFRKIYFKAFNTNTFQENFLQTSVGMIDCSYLLHTIILCCQAKSFCDLFRQTIAKYCTFHPVTIDNFNIRSDDSHARDEFNKNCVNRREEIVTVLYTLFDSPEEEEIEGLIDKILAENEEDEEKDEKEEKEETKSEEN